MIHKESDGALDQYINSIKFDSEHNDSNELSFDEVLKIVKYGL